MTKEKPEDLRPLVKNISALRTLSKADIIFSGPSPEGGECLGYPSQFLRVGRSEHSRQLCERVA